MNSTSRGFISLGIALAIAIMVGAVLVAGGWWYLNQSSTPETSVTMELPTTQKDSNMQSQKSLQPATTQTNATANWKTYTNATYGYRIKYPSDWSVTSETVINKNLPSAVTISDPNKTHHVEIDVAVNAADLTARVRAEKTTPVLPDYRQEQITIGNNSHIAYLYETECDLGESAPLDCSQFRIYILGENDTVYILYASGDARTVSDLYQNIFSTFSHN